MRKTKALLMSVACMGLVGGCGGNGTLSLQLTDAPPDTANLAAVTVTLSSVDVHLAGGDDEGEGEGKKDAPDGGTADEQGGGWVTLPGARSFDLLRLQNGVVASLGELQLPPGKITQIRLRIDQAGTNEVRLLSGQVCALDMGAVDKGGVKINHPFKALTIREGKTTDVVIDFDLQESVSKDADCVYRLHPVIKIKSAHEG
jgi:hypothetical protein